MNMLRFAWIPLIALLLSATSKANESSSPADPFAINLRADLPIMVGAGVLGGSLHAMREQIVKTRCAPHCDRNQVIGIDRLNLGDDRDGAALAGDILVGINIGLPLVFDLSYHRAVGARGELFLTDLLLVGQALAINTGLHQLVALATQRPRPFAYSARLDSTRAREANTYMAFYSGHTANSFVAATATSYLFSKRFPRSRWRLPLWTVTHGLAALDGYLRFSAGYHHVTDVVVGAVVGSSIGLLVPVLHELDPIARTVRVAPMAAAMGAGLAITWTQ